MILPDKLNPEDVLAKLTPLDRDLLMGRCESWGSWMWDCAGELVRLGLGTRRNGSIQFDTPLADAIRALLTSETPHAR